MKRLMIMLAVAMPRHGFLHYKKGIGIAMVAAIALSAHGFTTNVSTVTELAGALLYMNENYHTKDHEITLDDGFYDVTDLNLQYFNGSAAQNKMVDSGANFGISYFTLRGKTDDPRNVVIYRRDTGDNSLMLLYNYAGKIRNLTLSNCTTTASYAIGNINNKAIFSNVVVTCCTSTKTDGNGASKSGTWYACQFIGNSASGSGGALCKGGLAYGCTFEGNTAKNGGAADSSVLSNCLVKANTATANGGGTYDCTLSDCLVACNVAMNCGGGCFGSATDASVIDVGSVISNNTCGAGGAGAYRSTIRDSRVCMNFMDGSTVDGKYSSGGGVYACTVTRSTIDGNAVIRGKATTNTQGGGAYYSALTNCVICNNYVDNLGGGIAAGTAYGCIISNNASKTTSGSNGVRNMTSLVNCDIYEDTVDAQCPVVNCRILNYTNGNVIAEGANVYTNGLLAAPPQLVKSYGFFTNCLFAGNRVTTLIAHTSARHSVFSNCTFADNWYKNATSGFIGPTNTLTLINCIVARNRNQSGTADLNFNPTFGYMVLTNCVIGSFDNNVQLEYPMSNIITNNNPRFVDDGSRDSYALKRGSPAREKGLVQDWMTGALDIRNDERYERLRDGKVDIGCYECWLDPAGTQMIIR